MINGWRNWAYFCVIAVLICALVGCGGGSGGGGTAPTRTAADTAVTLSVSPATASVVAGSSLVLTANLSNVLTTGLTWTATAGSFTGSGTTVTYKAPANPGTYTVTVATSDNKLTASSTITVTAPPPPPPAESVTISPSTATIPGSTTLSLTATLAGTTSSLVTWTTSCGTITATGTTATFTAPSSATTCNVTVTTADGTASDTAKITVTQPNNPTVTVTVTPATATVTAGGSTSLTAAVFGSTNTSVAWSATGGTVSGTGLTVTYIAPSTAGTYTVTVAAAAGGTANSIITVTAPPKPTVNLNTSSASVNTGDVTTLTVTASGATITAVSWTTSGGTITGTGTTVTYTAPGTPGTYTVTANVTTSAGSSTATATFTVSAPPPPPPTESITVTPSPLSLVEGTSAVLNATVTNGSSTGITWTTSGGSITGSDASVTYTAPNAAGTFTVTATTADGLASATLTVTVTPPAISVSVSPSTAGLITGASVSVTATVSGTSNTAVTWAASGGSIAGTGNTITYTAPGTAGTFTVTATSVVAGVSATATFTVTTPPSPPVAVSISPSSTTLVSLTTTSLTATVTGSTSAPAWSTNGGTITGAGNTVTYTAPNTPGTYTVTATVAGVPGVATITVEAPPPPPAPSPITVTVSPTSTSIVASSSLFLTATVTGTTNTAVTWSTTGGTINGSGSTVTYIAPAAAGTYTVVAVSAASSTASGTSTITVTAPVTKTVVGIALSPSNSTMIGGSTQNFTATVTGTTDTSVTWNASGGTITGTGLTVSYTAPTVAGIYNVGVTSNADTSKTAFATITVPSPVVDITPISVNPVLGGATQTFVATVSGTNVTGVTWTASGGTIGSIKTSSTGASADWTAPGKGGTYNVTATSTADPRFSKSATVTVPTPVVSVPASATVGAGTATAFTASVTQTTMPGVTWTTSAGTISSSGVFTAPASSGTTVTITATSVADGTAVGKITVTVVANTVSITPTTATIFPGQTVLLTATVPGGSVTWSAALGSISGTGQVIRYAPPATPGQYTVIATSTVDPTKSASAVITVGLPTMTIYEVDGTVQNNRPITFGRVFRQGEITQCPQPVISGIAVASYQADVKNRWPDGSVRFAVISFTQTLLPALPTVVSFQDVPSCNNGGSLVQSQMTGFNAGNWDAQIVVTPAGGAAVTTSAKTMLAASDPGLNTFGDCKNNYWLQGPVVTAVIVQDCTAASPFDFGWTWDGFTMSGPVTGNNAHASFHPMFILYFYPASNSVQVEYILEMPWLGRLQDQLADITFKAGSPLTTVWSHVGARRLTDVSTGFGSTQITSASANFTSSDVGLPIDINGNWGVIGSVTNATTAQLVEPYSSSTLNNQTAYINLQVARTRHRKTFWSGATPGHIRIDHNFAYLKSTLAMPNYDPAVSVSPDTFCGGACTAYAQWVVSDKGEIGGNGGINAWPQDYASDSEGAPLQREELLYLYNMGSCGTANSACAKAWQMLTGESGAIDTSLTRGNVDGGAGVWNNLGNVPFHLRESRTVGGGRQSSTNFYYCPGFADKNATISGAVCSGSGATNVATGRTLSKHAHSDDGAGSTNIYILNPVGVVSSPPGGWDPSLNCDHWLDFAYTPYLLTGDYYYLEEEYHSASWCLAAISGSVDPVAGNSFFGYINYPSVVRNLAWTLQTTARAALIAPDNTPQANYFLSMMNSNLEVTEGIMGLTGTPLTPATVNSSCSSYNIFAANRWEFGRCSVASQCTSSACTPVAPALHFVTPGACSVDPTYLVPTVTSAWYSLFQYHFLSIVLSELRTMGYSQAAALSQQTHQSIEEMVLDSTYDPFLIAASELGIKDASGKTSCNAFGFNTDPFISNYSLLRSAMQTSIQGQSTFDGGVSGPAWQNFPCSDHGYSLIARAAASYLPFFGTSSNDANCPGGVCTALDTWIFLNTQAPYFTNVPPLSKSCLAVTGSSTWDEQIKFALTPR